MKRNEEREKEKEKEKKKEKEKEKRGEGGSYFSPEASVLMDSREPEKQKIRREARRPPGANRLWNRARHVRVADPESRLASIRISDLR